MSKLAKSIIGGVLIILFSTGIIFYITDYISHVEHEIIQDKDIIYLDAKIRQNDSLNKNKNIANNNRLNKINDKNTTEHKEIKDGVIEIKEDVAEIKGMLKILIKQRLLANE